MPNKTAAIGHSVHRRDAHNKVTGAARYSADINVSDLLYAVVLRSPHHHAIIKSIDTEAATQMVGVVSILTGKDLPAKATIGAFIQDQPVLALERVRHMGEPVAIVVAFSKIVAQSACAKIIVEYELLPAIHTATEALLPDAVSIHPTGNLCAHYKLTHGDLAGGLALADIVVEESFEVQRISPAYMEPEASLGTWHEDGSLIVWTSSQKPFADRSAIAEVVGMPEEKVIVRNAEVGGAFGGKEDSILACLAALAAFKTGRSVLLNNERWESFVAHPKRHPANLKIKIGARADGTFTALSAQVAMDTGAYASYGPVVGAQLTELMPGSYRTPNVLVETNVCYTNNPYAGAMRGFGNPQASFALESILNILAQKLGMDPLELRRRNMLRPGDSMATGLIAGPWALSLAGVIDSTETALQKLKKKSTEQNNGQDPVRVGVGFALAMQCMGLGSRVPDRSTQKVEWQPDGSIHLYLGTAEIGQGLATVAEQMLAAALGVEPSRVVASSLDTSKVFDGGVTCASRMTYLVGNALSDAAARLIAELINQAALLLGVPVASLRYEDGYILDDTGLKITATDIAARAAEEGIIIQAVGFSDFPEPEIDANSDLPMGMPHSLFVFGAHVVRVEIDEELGKINLTDLVAIHDPGRVINPSLAAGQVQGGALMGVGYALYEDMPLKNNGQWVKSFTEYLIPTSKDLPGNLEIVFLETPEASSAFGAKGLGEIVLVPTAPAIANAVNDATGIRVTHLPISAEDLIFE